MAVADDLLGKLEILPDRGLLVPRNPQQSVDIVARDGRFRRHRRHLLELLQFARSLLARFLRKLGALNLLFKLCKFVGAVHGGMPFLVVANLKSRGTRYQTLLRSANVSNRQ
jgi:hypothetical protein